MALRPIVTLPHQTSGLHSLNGVAVNVDTSRALRTQEELLALVRGIVVASAPCVIAGWSLRGRAGLTGG
jgi:hypothetical protein